MGDFLSRCSAVILKDGSEGEFQSEGYGSRPFTNFNRREPRVSGFILFYFLMPPRPPFHFPHPARSPRARICAGRGMHPASRIPHPVLPE